MVVLSSVVPVVSVIVVFFVPAAAIVLTVWFSISAKNKRNQLKADLFGKALEKGQTLPTDLFAEPKKNRKRNPLNIGIIHT